MTSDVIGNSLRFFYLLGEKALKIYPMSWAPLPSLEGLATGIMLVQSSSAFRRHYHSSADSHLFHIGLAKSFFKNLIKCSDF